MSVSDEVRAERQRQRRQWGAQHDRNLSWWDWQGLMRLRVRLIEPQGFRTGMNKTAYMAKRRRALIELAALAIAAVEANEDK